MRKMLSQRLKTCLQNDNLRNRSEIDQGKILTEFDVNPTQESKSKLTPRITPVVFDIVFYCLPAGYEARFVACQGTNLKVYFLSAFINN